MSAFDNSSDSLSLSVPVGSQGGDGSNPSSFGVNGNSKSNITVINTPTDLGAVNGAFDLVGKVVLALGDSVAQVVQKVSEGNVDVSITAIEENARLSEYAMGQVNKAYQGAGDLVDKAVRASYDFSERALSSLDEAVYGAISTANGALDQARSVVDLTERLNDQNTFFLTDVNKKNAELTSEVIRNSELLTGEVIRTVEDLEQMRLVESGKVIGTIKELAETVQTGGESIQQNVNKLVVYAALAMAGLIAWRALA